MRKLMGCFLCLVLLLSAAVPVLAEEGAEIAITTAEEFLTFAENCRLDSYSMALTVSLEADIDLSGRDFAGIPIFCGTFLGNGHTVSGLNITVHGSEQGLFRYLTQSAQVQDLNVTGKVMPQGSRANVGGIAGRNAGMIKKCTFSGEISGGDSVGGIAGSNTASGSIRGCSTEGNIYGNHFVGGIAGQNAGVIRSCENFADVNTTPQQNSIDISDITIGTITGTESVSTVTDIGGIAGFSSGTIRYCTNRADVGYKHMGYNIGGIAGSQSGYLTKCENYGAVSGRKEVGGIVGHMEPSILLSYETDTLQILQGQMAVLGDLVDRAAMNAQSNTANIGALVTRLENHVANAEAAIDVLTIDPENPQIQDFDTYTAALQTLSSSITGIDHTVRSLYQAVKDTGSDLNADLQAISDQMEVIDGTLNSAGENLGGTVNDVSDADTKEDLTSKIEASRNYGPVLGDLNVGGIVGAMALENDLDPEEDVTVSGGITLNAAAQLRSVVLDSVNSGAVTAKRQNAGGIVGWQSMGLVKGCINAGALDGGDYTGGIAGQSLGYIRASFARCEVAGDAFAGGIAGSGTVVTDCRSMVRLSGSERIGAILGFAEENHTDVRQPILNNCYTCVEADPGAIDGISYDTLAQPMELDAFLGLEELPRLFRKVTVTFIFEDGTTQEVSLTPGSALAQKDIPQIPAKAGFVGKWAGLEDANVEALLFDAAFEVLYVSHGTTIQSTENRDGRPILLVQGDFAPDAAVTMAEPESGPVLGKGETLLESWQFAITRCEHTTGIRYLLPAGTDAEKLRLYVRSANGDWKQAEYTVDGSYIVLSIEHGDDGIALAEIQGVKIPWLLLGAVAGAVAATVIAVAAVRRRKQKKAVMASEAAPD